MTNQSMERSANGSPEGGWRVARRPLGRSGLLVSAIGLGGHEFGAARHIKGFHDDLYRVLTPGVIFPGFGGPDRLAIVAEALAHGVNFFDVTIDSEKEALGRNLQDLGALDQAIIQTRPCGFVYTYDPGNQSFLNKDKLFREIERICSLLRRQHIDILNVGLESDALARPGYLETLAANLRALKEAGLIKLAGCDSFSGAAAYEQMIRAGCFDVLYIIYNPLADSPESSLFPLARAHGMGIVIKEAFLKGQIFEAAAAIGVQRADYHLVAQATLRWILRRPEVSTILVGTSSPQHLVANLHAAGQASLAARETALIEELRRSDNGRLLRARQKWAFNHGLPPNTSPPPDEVVLRELDQSE